MLFTSAYHVKTAIQADTIAATRVSKTNNALVLSKQEKNQFVKRVSRIE
jgi:hypothetical protein